MKNLLKNIDVAALSSLDAPTMQPNNWGLTPKAKGAEQNTNQSAKGSDPNWLGGQVNRYGCTSMSAWLAGHDACEAANDLAWRVAA